MCRKFCERAVSSDEGDEGELPFDLGLAAPRVGGLGFLTNDCGIGLDSGLGYYGDLSTLPTSPEPPKKKENASIFPVFLVIAALVFMCAAPGRAPELLT